MCGICGVLSQNVDHAVSIPVVQGMASTLAHRGPDASGYYLYEPPVNGPRLAMGHRRLAIIDLTTGDQPLYNEDKSLCLVGNGEIYNYPLLKDELEKSGHHLRTKSDNEVILHLYEDHGLDFVDHLAGMFAFALWDEKLQRLLLVRDRMGVKPLHYHYHNGLLVFGSEIKAILAHPQVQPALSMPSLYQYLTFEYVPAPDTILQHTHKVEPGNMVIWEGGELKLRTYWDLRLNEGDELSLSEGECIERLDTLFTEAVKRRLLSDVEIGVFLSGGLDSSLVLTRAQQFYPHPMKAFTIGFEDKSFDESSYAEKVSRLAGADFHLEVLTEARLIKVMEKLDQILDEPFADQSVVPNYLISQLASRRVKVVLSGDGGDDILAGYDTYKALKLVKLYQVIPTKFRSAINKLIQNLPVKHKYISVDFKLKQFMRGAGYSSEVMFFQWMGSLNNQEKEALLLPSHMNALRGVNTWSCLNRHIQNSLLCKDLERILYLMMKLYLQDDILLKVDRASMANSLEVRSPFMDHYLVEFVNSLPSNLKIRRLTTKYILKKMGARVLPKDIVYRRKQGFGIPIGRWFQGKLKSLLTDYLSPERIAKGGFFDPKFISQMVKAHLEGEVDFRKPLWTILLFEMWRERWLDTPPQPAAFPE